ncbi:MAG: hypothetical protein O6826_04480 [Acidobacteria bacterium]|nr:hypothetical protein [Acidobacteriota bacterium]
MLQLIQEGKKRLFLSAASSWEIAIKYSLGKLQLPVPPSQYVPERLARNTIAVLAIEHSHALQVASLPPHHRAPLTVC